MMQGKTFHNCGLFLSQTDEKMKKPHFHEMNFHFM